MFAKINVSLPFRWLYVAIALALSASILQLPPGQTFYCGCITVFITSLASQYVLEIPFGTKGINRYWLQLICSQACKWLVFSLIMYLTIIYNLVNSFFLLGIIAGQVVIFWNYIKYG